MLEAEIVWFAGYEALAELREEAMPRPPMARFASPDEIAKTILFLVADAPHATGTILRIDCGTTVV